MGLMAERLDALVASASSPDGRIEGSYGSAAGASIRFLGSSYRHYTERGLEHQLSRLAILIWTAYQRGYDTTVAEVSGHPVSRSTETWDANRRRFREEQAATVAEGMSDGGLVYFQNTGMLDWHIIIRDGTLSKLDENEFVDELLSGYAALSRDYRRKMTELRTKHYGPDIWQRK
ncbi:MAG: hypothetical protein ACRD0P_09785 [Stackebrandtia sp.]